MLYYGIYCILQRPRAAAEISPVNESRQMKVDFDPTCKVSYYYNQIIMIFAIFNLK